ncbi:hypothetical protein BTO30_11430 [Domibacillus antri]|uniref:Uncharacterized protein n=1 Tax=Domibacillus antri TaxID=1714264 RepID=A0A1Q8Q444_9BACI|nr:hypothetical protein BTO30_11430 [Domibacillus antri]
MALAVPLYNQRQLFMRNVSSIIIGAGSGILVTFVLAVLAGKWIGLNESIILSVMPQLTTMPIALALSEEIGGIPPVTAAFVVIASVPWGVFRPFVLNGLRVKSPVGRGIGMGCASLRILSA